MRINVDAVYKKTLAHYHAAKQNLPSFKKGLVLEHYAEAVSDVIPGFKADELQFGSFDKENFAVLFVDMRSSTARAAKYGPEITFLTMHVFFSALLEVVKHRNGKLIDIMGDGLMVFWGGKKAREADGESKEKAIQRAGLCGRDMLTIKDDVINRIIKDEKLGNPISIGVGVTFGDVVVTKIGINDYYDVKAIGDCINKASKYADKAWNKVKVSKEVKQHWPSGENGKIAFVSVDGEDAFYLDSK